MTIYHCLPLAAVVYLIYLQLFLGDEHETH